MRIVILAVSLALMLACGEALDCLHCVPARAGGDCEVKVQTCPPEKNACAAAKFRLAPYGHFQRCIDMSGCKNFELNAYIDIKCCDTDKCNTF
ncbi:alpha-elapitoxin-Aa2e [Esox lucius]|uniref:UPAR/Ly6 domain-containing protein n=1 Tax=Esox lucius TaxID=8010 RepID=A0AAY5KBS5_ESOLU|nr:alpha-elapitoxin-Aa2e [Esox lucius]